MCRNPKWRGIGAITLFSAKEIAHPKTMDKTIPLRGLKHSLLGIDIRISALLLLVYLCSCLIFFVTVHTFFCHLLYKASSHVPGVLRNPL
jgi:hypothetical protein